MQRERIDVAVVGAGVVGLAVARLLSRLGREVLVLEKEAQIGTGVSSRSSEVIHAGIYYPKGSLKANLCVEGARRLYRYCAAFTVPHNRCGKLVVATSGAQIPQLRAIQAAAAANGAGRLAWLFQADVAALEPEVQCTAGLHSPGTGIIDSHALMLALQGDAEAHGATVVTSTPVIAATACAGGGITLQTPEVALDCSLVVNAAGLGALPLLATVSCMAEEFRPRQYFAKGHYYRLVTPGPPPFRRLVYPVPEAAGLGVHATLDLGGAVRFGPDVKWVTSPDDLSVDNDPGRVAAFYASVRRYYPALPDGSLEPDYAGIRPKLQAPGGPFTDFAIQGPNDHKIAGLVNLLGIESPGLTACLAIARRACIAAGCDEREVERADYY